MSEKVEVDQDCEDDDQGCANSSPVELPEHQYTKQELVDIADSPASRLRPPCLDRIYDTKEGKWDPEQWWGAKFGSRESSPLTLGDCKDRRRVVDLDRDTKKRASVNDPVERLKEERDGIVLSPQRRSFVTGCHVQAPSISYSRQLSLPERDREEPRPERDRDRDRDRGDRERDRPLRKIGSGRIQIDRETSRDFSNLRDRFDDRERDRDHPWSRDRVDRERDWERDRDSDWDRDRERDRRFERDRSDRFRRVSDNQYPERDRTRERDFRDRDRDRDRGFDRSGRRRNNYTREDEKEPEWFTGGPTSQTDTIELRGFDTENQKIVPDEKSRRNNELDEDSQQDKLEKESSENDDCFLPDPSDSGGNHMQESKGSHGHLVSHPEREHQHTRSLTPQQKSVRLSPSVAVSDKHFDLEEILKAHLPLSEEGEVQGSRFSRFFGGPTGNMTDSRASSLEDILMPHDLLEENMSKPKAPLLSSHIPSSSAEILPKNFVQTASSHNTDTSSPIYPSHGYAYPIPHSAGDNNGGMLKSSLSAPVTALFNSAMAGGANACMSSNGSFSSQDAEAQLKAMLFGGGHRESASSSGTASPASLRPSSSRRIKTLAEVEADMHQSSPTKTVSPDPSKNVMGGNSKQNGGDMAAFNKLLTLISAASDSGQNVPSNPLVSSESSSHGYISSNNEFAYALKRNKEHQMMLQQSTQPQPPIQGQRLVAPASIQGHPVSRHPYVDGVYVAQKMENVVPPQAASTPVVHQNPTNKPRLQALGANASNDPIFNLIQQNPAIVMKPAPTSPSFSMATLMTSQQPISATNARIPSPLIFSQQPPLHLSAPSPINPTQLVPGAHHLSTNVNAAPHPSSSGMVSPVQQGALSPQHIAMHTQAVMQNALIKKHLQNQNEQFVKKQLERTKSPSQQQHINVVKSQPAAQLVLPPNPQPKGTTLDTFTPTSVLRKMHSDRAIEKEKQSHETDKEEPSDYIHPSAPPVLDEPQSNSDGQSMDTEGFDVKGMEEGNELSFLNPVNPNLVSLSNQLENSLKLNTGQINILPGSLSQPMSVEEKMKLSSLVEKRDFSQMLESKVALDVPKGGIKMAGIPGRPIVRGADQVRDETPAHHQYHLQNLVMPQQQQLQQQQQQQQQQPPPQILQYPQRARAVTGGGGMIVQGSYASLGPTPPPVPPPPLSQPSLKGTAGRAIVGSSSIQQQQQQQHPPPPPPLGLPPGPPPPVGAALTPEIMRMIEQQKQHQQLQQHYQQAQSVPQGSMAVPPPMVGSLAFGASHIGVPMNTRMPFSGVPAHNNASAALMHQHISRANAISPQRNQYMALMALHQAQAQGIRPLPSVGDGGGASPSHSSQAMGAVSPHALPATLQRVVSPCANVKMNGPRAQTSLNVNGSSSKPEIGTSIQRWFSADILKNQLPSMPPLPAQGSHVLTVDELEGN